MNENIDLTKILKDCPKGTKFYSTIYGDVEFEHINESNRYPIVLRTYNDFYPIVTKNGKHILEYDNKAECTLFPSKEQRDWAKFTAPWYKRDRFDPKTLNPFDRVLVRDNNNIWSCNFFSHIDNINPIYPYMCAYGHVKYCIPYNDDTKHLVGTTDEAPEYYRYWED